MTSVTKTHRSTRDELIEGLLKAELVGPQISPAIPTDSLYRKSLPDIKPLDINGLVNFSGHEEVAAMFVNKATGEEILKLSPLARYGCGILYPQESETVDTEQQDESSPVNEESTDLSSKTKNEKSDKPAEEQTENTTDAPDFDVSLTNARLPASMAISFVLDTASCERLSVHFSAATYKPFKVSTGSYTHDWWYRTPFSLEVDIPSASILKHHSSDIAVSSGRKTGEIPEELLNIKMISRSIKSTGQTLVTIALTNVSKQHSPSSALFQTELSISAFGKQNQGCILPYPENNGMENSDEELASYELLYRHDQTFAIGHGCAADWDSSPGEGKQQVTRVFSQSIPTYETASITPDVIKQDGQPLSVSMEALSQLQPSNVNSGVIQLQELINEYQAWISIKAASIPLLASDQLKTTADRHLEHCRLCLQRMQAGLNLLTGQGEKSELAREAFRLANLAMLTQQKHTFRESRHPEIKAGKATFSELQLNQKAGGQWRAFQIGFLLMSIASCVNREDPFREDVDLIWFPTGGGKTEAYLALTAFTMFYDRLAKGDDCSGVQVLMRYTLRLLTTQQFTRAATLICAMETIRQQRNDLGEQPYSIGLWVGGANTPNTHQGAQNDLKHLQSGKGENRFLFNKCPWCAAAMGPSQKKGKARKQLTPGYKKSGEGIVLHCPDAKCDFSHRLPVLIVDEDIYQQRPSLLIGTVDKFAQLSWRSDIRRLFGIDDHGNRQLAPPALIIQDELHLISGPLGTMVGLYEPLIEDLCTDKRIPSACKPRIVCSTATIRRYQEQSRALYGRTSTHLFPPSGLEAEDSFFAVYAREDKSKSDDEKPPLKAGRKYLGIMAPGLGSLQTVQVRAFTALLQAPQFLPEKTEETSELPENARDPWWTLLAFYNSLRELGGGLTLFQSDIQDYWREIQKRYGKNFPYRYLNRIEELTSRLRNDEVPDAIRKLEVTTDSETEKAVDACIASSIIEVGIDIDRLSLMCIVGQPKTTAQYIQVSGRVGRKWWERPGLVCTLYSPGKPRDRSHYEHFRSYHQKLYGQVEPTSVTPFSEPALERALHSVMTAWARQYQNLADNKTPYPMPGQLLEKLEDILMARLQLVTSDSRDRSRFEKLWKQRLREWKTRSPINWGDYKNHDNALIYPAGKHVTKKTRDTSWATMTSMRTVDSECRIEINNPYLQEEEA